MLNSEHFSKIQKALDATAFRLEEAGAEFGPSAMTHAQEELENAVKTYTFNRPSVPMYTYH